MFRRPLLVAALAAFLAAPALSTWSIVVVNRATGEVAIACATCVEGINLATAVPVIRVGRGAAAAQSYLDDTQRNRRAIYAGLDGGVDPFVILQNLSLSDPGHETRQYGIVDLDGRAVTFTGTQAGAFAAGLTGVDGDLVYAIQGNVLTGLPVLTAAEQALRATPGDLAAKLMAAMQAARAMGGDGRCSCPSSTPFGCGAPPPSFTHSSYVAHIIIARIGDQVRPCGSIGCAMGQYFAKLEANWGLPTDPDAVVRLQGLYDTWRQNLIGRTDQVRSVAFAERTVLPADRFSRTRIRLRLNDWQGTPVTNAAATFTVRHAAGSAGIGQPSAVTSIGNGEWAFDVQATERAGTDLYEIVVQDGGRAVQLHPPAELRFEAVPALQVDRASISAAQGEGVLLRLDGGLARAQREYVMLLGLSGTAPGTLVAPGINVPLNFDDATAVGIELLNTPFFVSSWGRLQSDGRSLAALQPLPGTFTDILGYELSFAWVMLQPIDFASNAVSVRIAP
ncbi:MAG: DUF1028 domain-containing protein [Planctomycetes bacterium]|nr:DUF1028 domain-containing protein [Planctomycetota bacterium]